MTATTIDKCPVCGRTPNNGDRMGFTSMHRDCADAWNDWTEEQRRKAIEKRGLKK